MMTLLSFYLAGGAHLEEVPGRDVMQDMAEYRRSWTDEPTLRDLYVRITTGWGYNPAQADAILRLVIKANTLYAIARSSPEMLAQELIERRENPWSVNWTRAPYAVEMPQHVPLPPHMIGKEQT